jgi:hypothetical protein
LGQQKKTFFGFKTGALRPVQNCGTNPGPFFHRPDHLNQGLLTTTGGRTPDRNDTAFLCKPGQIFPVLTLTEHNQRVNRSKKPTEKNGGPMPGNAYELPGPRVKLFMKVILQYLWTTGLEPSFKKKGGNGHQGARTPLL